MFKKYVFYIELNAHFFKKFYMLKLKFFKLESKKYVFYFSFWTTLNTEAFLITKGHDYLIQLKKLQVRHI